MANPQKQSIKASARSGEKDPKEEALAEGAFRVPKGVPRWQFLMLIGLMLFLLVTWLVPNAIYGITGKGSSAPTNPVAVSWNRVGGGKVELLWSEFQGAERAL